MFALKLIVDKLEKLKLFEPFKLTKKTTKVAEDSHFTKLERHPFSGYNSKIISLVGSLTYRK